MGTRTVKVSMPHETVSGVGNPAGSWPMLLHVEQAASERQRTDERNGYGADLIRFD